VYIRDREPVLEEVISAVGCTRETAKQLFIRLMFGGKVNSWKRDFNISRDISGFCHELQWELQTIKEHFVAQPDHVKYVKIPQHIERKEGYSWENNALAFWLRDLEAQCMITTIDYLIHDGAHHVTVSSLIHDGVLIDKSDKIKVNLEALDEHVKADTGLKCSFVVKDMPPQDKDLEWKAKDLESYVEAEAERVRVATRRDEFTKMMSKATIKIGSHLVIANMFHKMFPRRFT